MSTGLATDASAGSAARERRAGRLAERLDAEAARLAGVGAQDRRAARVGHDGDAVALRAAAGG